VRGSGIFDQPPTHDSKRRLAPGQWRFGQSGEAEIVASVILRCFVDFLAERLWFVRAGIVSNANHLAMLRLQIGEKRSAGA